MTELGATLVGMYPGRDNQIDQLLSLLGKPADPSPPCIFIYGPSATGKTSLTQTLFQHYDTTGKHHAYINSIECFNSRLLFERTLNAWMGYQPSAENRFGNYVKCDNLVDFINYTRELLPHGEKHFMVVDQAERLRDRGAMLLTSLMRLSELTGRDVSVVLISNVIWDKFRPRHGGASDPVSVFFPYYEKNQILDILVKDCPPEEPQSFFLTFVDAIYEVFRRNCVDLNELRHLVAMLYPKFVQPVFEKQATRAEFPRLFKLCQPYFTAASDRLYLREISTSEWQKNSTIASVKNNPEDVAMSIYQMADSDNGLDLPHYTKFLLISAYLASYNPARLDVQYFAKGKDPKKSRKKKAVTNGENALGGHNRQQLMGPKLFAIERMLAIFYSIVAEPVKSAVDVQIQIASLVTLRLLTKTSAGDRLDGIRCKCNVSLDTIRTISRSVRFEIDRYLYDFA
ncbi:origin recognition complex subunit 5 C-terminus-domain-containing protein [Kickxella alabastrina]|uniref:origin recognition complex subunit 5 C-terminus-domain-containing protein n=1 Tax=Kickxella alabastrina TaxID=61397 RepID=UPI002220F7A6|nr:origin recognition complex subunit 5 C-terminus-domain-containing protein [Kickxella alabastrina]KAI7834021.1 origin recognition complex subunit 5 C-terminus-domain-containing protein [Kickxella alabastrina]